MKKHERTKYEMLRRVRDFGAAHRELFPETTPGGQAFQAIANAIEEFDTNVVTRALVVKQGREDMVVARAAIRREMRVIARTGRSLRKAAVPSARKLRMPGQVSGVALLGAAETFLKESEPHREALLSLGMPATALSTLRESMDSLDAALTVRGEGRRAAKSASEAIKRAFANAGTALATLDIVVPNLVERDSVLFAGWMRDRVVVNGQHKRPSVSVEPVNPANTSAAAPVVSIVSPDKPFPKAS